MAELVMTTAEEANRTFLQAIKEKYEAELTRANERILAAARNLKRETILYVEDAEKGKCVGIYLASLGYEVWGKAGELTVSWKPKEK